MAYRFNPLVDAGIASPVSESQDWIAGRTFPADKPLLNIAQAVPGYPPAPALNEHLAGLLNHPQTSLYTGIFGMEDLRRELAGQMAAEYHGAIDPAQVAIIAGCNQGFCVAASTLAQPGDEAILPLPYYFNHHMWLEMQGIKPVLLPFNERDGVPEPADAAALITERTRIIALVTPNNPTGAVYPPAVIEAFYQLARRHDLALVLDETYKDFRAEPEAAHGLFQHADWADTLVQLYSFSKAYSLTGYRVGSIICSDALLYQIGKLLDCVAICAPRIGQEAALYGLRNLAAWREDKRKLMQNRLAALKAAFSRNTLHYQLVCSGAYFAYVRHPFAGESAHTVARRLADDFNILCLPGDTFGPGQADYLRIAFANLEAGHMDELIDRLIESQR